MKKNKKILIFFLFLVSLCLPAKKIWADEINLDDGLELKSPPYGFKDSTSGLSNVVYNGNKLVFGPNIFDEVEKQGKQLIPITYKGEKSVFITDEGKKKMYDAISIVSPNDTTKGDYNGGLYFSQHLKKGDIFYFNNFGEYNGKTLRLKISSNYDYNIQIGYQSANLSINTKNSPYGLTDFYYMLVDENDNPIDDENYWFYLTGYYGATIEKVTSWNSETGEPVEIKPTNIGYANYIFDNDSIDNFTTTTLEDSFLRTAKLAYIDKKIVKMTEMPRHHDYKNGPNVGSLAQSKIVSFVQKKGEKTHVIRNLYDRRGERFLKEPLDYAFPNNGAYFSIFKESNLPIRIAYGYPIIRKTINNNTDAKNRFKAKISATQILPSQSSKELYPKNFEINIDLHDKADLINQSTLKASDFKLMLDGKDISNQAKISMVEPGKLKITFTQDQLAKIGDASVQVEGLVELKHNDDKIYDYIDSDGYIFIEGIKAKNNINAKEDISDKLKIKVPGPTGTPIPISVIEGDTTENLDANNLVKNLQSYLPNDSVVVKGFKEPKTFSDIGETTVEVILQSKRVPKATSIISVPVSVISSQLPKLKPITIQPELNKEAHTKKDLTYNPSFIQSFSALEEATTDNSFNEVNLFFNYSDQLSDVNVNNFSLSMDGHELDKSYYKLNLDSINHRVTVTFTKASLASNLKNKEITIKQHSQIKTSDSEILKLYDKQTHQFTFKISANNSYNFKSDQPLIQSKVVTENQTVKYEPKITAKPIKNKTVEPGSPVGNASDYIETVSSPDFEFDQYDIAFKNEPNFSEAGTKEFDVIIKSKSFGTFIEVPVSVNVTNPTVNMKVKQVYKEDNSHAIYSDIENKKLVDNTKDQYEVKINDPITNVLEGLPSDKFNLKYKGYVPAFNPTYKIIVDNKEVFSETVPDQDFTLVLEYDGTVEINADDLDFGKVPVSLVNLSKTTSIKDKYVTLVDTTLTNKNEIQVNLLKPLYDSNKNQTLLGGLFIQKSSQTIYVTTKGQTFYETPNTEEKKMLLKLPMNMGVYQNLGNSGGKYKGTVQWSIINGPGL